VYDPWATKVWQDEWRGNGFKGRTIKSVRQREVDMPSYSKRKNSISKDCRIKS